MSRVRYRRKTQEAPQGLWLAFLALAIQTLLPFLVSYEIALASSPALAETMVICSASGPATTPAGLQANNHAAHHGIAAHACPLCIALASSQVFAAAHSVALPLPQGNPVAIAPSTVTLRTGAAPAASYNPRAPPFIA
jgi:hypothetical protein